MELRHIQEMQELRSSLEKQEYFTFSQAARLMGVSRQYIYKLVKEDKLRASRISGRMALVRRADIELMLKSKPYERLVAKNDFDITEYYTAEEIAEKYNIRGLHLLAAEDNELNAEIVEMLLTDDGAKVTVVKNGRQAVEHFENNPPGTFDAILMDVMMPVMDGIAATKAIRAMDRADAKTIPIIAMTANAFEEDAKRCLAAGMTAHLAKPFQIEDVEKTIVECCGK